ncbi:LysE family translocator [Blastomonas aquatica]|uniref:LysE family translocator n=1 Tax=Blastomonas aquatica TaxID=1510276 RepID=UPI001E542EB4|nr:LysE family translocator [Blastomonas aquatica]
MHDISLGYATMLASYVMTVFVIELTPGPNMAYLAALTLGAGRRAGLAAVAGVAIGLALIGVAAAAGLAALVAASPTIWTALRWAGGLYLLYLAWETWRGEAETSPAGTHSLTRTNARYFSRGVITNILNPKAALFYVAIVPRFLPQTGPTLGYGLGLTAISVAVATAIHLAIVLLAARLHPVLSQPGRLERTRHLLAIGLAAIAVWFLLTTTGPST